MEFRLLGPVEVEEGGRALSLGGRRQRAVLTHLLLRRGSPVTSDELIELAWGDAAPPAVRTSLHTYVSRLRAELGAARLETRSTGYLLHADAKEVDAARFENLLDLARRSSDEDPAAAQAAYDDALALLRGPALGDLADEPSLAVEAARLDGLVAAARRERVAVGLRLGRHEALLPELEDLLRRDPLQEDVWGSYVLALYRCGRQADALRAYERARAAVRDELGLEPSESLRRLHARVLRQDPGLSLQVSALRGYRLLGVLGEGSSAVVHRAVQPHTGREVALKALHPWLADDPDLVRRFAAEAPAALQLEHPNVVPLHDFWREPGGALLAMRLMRGGSLADRLERGPLDGADLVRIAEQVTGALEALRSRGAVDTPVGPEDVLLDEHDNAYLAGFCLARQLAAATVPASVAGRPAVDAAPVGRLLLDVLARQPAPPAAAVAFAERAAAAGFDGARGLCAALRTALEPTLPSPREPVEPMPRRNPYKGLRAFGEADAGDFFGRAALVESLVARLSEATPSGPRRFLAVVGPSGSGKSSLVRAGLVPALRAGAVTGGPWYVADLVPGMDPFAELVRALRTVAVRPLAEDVADALRRRPAELLAVVRSVLPDHDGELLVFVDQFEELFTVVTETDRTAFVELLVAATAADSRLRVVVTLRADFYDRPLGDPALAELLRQGTEVVVPLTAEGLEQAVVEPAARAGLRVEPALLAQVVADVGDTSTSLPLLQYALTETADRREGDELTLAGYRALGGVSGALVRRADAVWSGLAADEQAVARQVLLQLVHPDESGADTRRRVLLAELEQRTGDPATSREVVAALGAARLVAFDRDPATRAPTVEVAHEALLREWALLRAWLDDVREDLRTERRLTATAQEWDETGREPSFLAAGSRLDALERWADRWSGSSGWTPTALEQAFLDGSLRAREQAEQEEQQRRDRELALERRSVRRLRAGALVLAAAVVGVSALTVYGFAQRDRAERESLVAQARALAAASAASVVDDPERAVLLALEAVRTSREAEAPVLPEAEEALHSAVTASRVRLTMPAVGGAVDWSAGGLLVTEGPEDSGLVELRSGDTGAVVRSWPGHDVDVNDVAFSPDGSSLLTTGDDGAARLWDPATGRLVWEQLATGPVWAPTFSGDGRRAAASWPDEDVVRVLDVASGAVAGEVRSVPEPYATALTHDGADLVVTGKTEAAAEVRVVATGELVRTVRPGAPSAREAEISPDGRWLVTVGFDFKARIWSVADGSHWATLHASSPIRDVDWSADSSRLVVGGDDGIVRVYALEGEGPRELLRLSSTVLRGVLGVAFSPDAGRVLLGDSNALAAQVFDVSVAGSQEWLTAAVPSLVAGADFTADGRQVASSSSDGGLVFREVEGGAVVRAAGADRGTVAEVSTSPDGSLVAGVTDGAVVVWDAADGTEVFAVPTEGPSWELTWSDDGSLLGFTTDDFGLRLVDRTGARVDGPDAADPDDGVVAVAFSPDGRLVVTAHRRLDRTAAGTGTVQVFDRDAGSVVSRWRVDSDRLAVSPDGRLVAEALPSGDLALHRLETGERVSALVGHVGPVWDLAFSPDGRTLASAGQDATVRLWDVTTGRQRLALLGHSSVVFTVRFSGDGARLVTTSGDGTVRVWAADLDDLVRMAQDRVTRTLTDDECRRYLQRACT